MESSRFNQIQLSDMRIVESKYLILLVGAGRFELPTPCAQGRCATRLRYAPTFYFSDSKPLSPVMQLSAKRASRREGLSRALNP